MRIRSPGDGEARRARAQLQLGHRSALLVRDRARDDGGRPGKGGGTPPPVFRPSLRNGHPDHLRGHGGRDRISRRPAPPSRRNEGGTRQLAPVCRDLLRVVGANVGARSDDQGPGCGGGFLGWREIPGAHHPVRVPEVPGFHLPGGDQGDEGPDRPRIRARPEE